jgi:tetratricopeptide (TPR) repeat protein
MGIKIGREKGTDAALVYEQRAIQLDPNFALANALLGIQYGNLGEAGRASEYLTKAFELREHASERERLVITARYYESVTGELDKAVQAYQQLIDNYPRDSVGYFTLSTTYGSQGKYEKGIEIMRQAQQLAPDRIGSYSNLANFQLALQRVDEARQTIRNAQERKLDDFILHNALYGLAFLAADSSAMAQQQQWFADHPGVENFGLSLALDSDAYDGDLGKAGELTKRAADSAIRADSKESGAIWWENAALREAAFGNSGEAKQAAAEGLKLYPESQAVMVEAGLAYATVGDNTRAQSLAQDLNKRYPLDTRVQSLWLPAIQAQLALNRKAPAEAIDDVCVCAVSGGWGFRVKVSNRQRGIYQKKPPRRAAFRKTVRPLRGQFPADHCTQSQNAGTEHQQRTRLRSDSVDRSSTELKYAEIKIPLTKVKPRGAVKTVIAGSDRDWKRKGGSSGVVAHSARSREFDAVSVPGGNLDGGENRRAPVIVVHGQHR